MPIPKAKILEIYFYCDEFLKALQLELQNQIPEQVQQKKLTREPNLSYSEIMSICVLYHLSHFKCFEYYYNYLKSKEGLEYYPNLCSYERMVQLKQRVCQLLPLFLICICNDTPSEYSYCDSKRLVVCHNRRIHQNRTFKGIAQRGKSSTGWFYGFKIFLVINQVGQLVSFSLTKGNVADNNADVMIRLLSKIKTKIYADKGFINSRVFELLLENGTTLITGIRQNMKNKLMLMEDKLRLKKRGVIESVNDILMTICDIEHSRHRSPLNFLTNTFAALIAYTFLDQLPKAFIFKQLK